MAEPETARHCPCCSQSIECADLVVFSAGDVFHHRCFVANGGKHDPVHEFLCRQYPAGFCEGCLSRTLELTDEQAQELFATLRNDSRLIILLGGRCARCQRPRLTVQAVAREEPQRTLVSHLPLQRPGAS